MSEHNAWTLKKITEFIGECREECRVMINIPGFGKLIAVETIQVRADNRGDFVVVVSGKPSDQ